MEILRAMRHKFEKSTKKLKSLSIEFQSISISDTGAAPHSSVNESSTNSSATQLTTRQNDDDTIQEDDGSESEDRQNPEPVLYARGNTRVSCSKPLLLQLFGCVSLLNLSESQKCRDAIIDAGGIHDIFEASRRVEDQSDLWFIIYYIFSKFTQCGEHRIVYTKPKGTPRLVELSKRAIMNKLVKETELPETDNVNTLKAISDTPFFRIRSFINASQTTQSSDTIINEATGVDSTQDPKTSKNKPHIDTFRSLEASIKELELPYHLKEHLQGVKACTRCKKACFDSHCVRMYEISRAKNSSIQVICSLDCAKSDGMFQNRKLFEYSNSS